MTDLYQQLLKATIQHLEGLKSRGVRFVSAAPELLTQLAASRTAPLRQVVVPRGQASPESQISQPRVIAAEPPTAVFPKPEPKAAAAQASLLTMPGEVSVPASRPE